MPQNLVHGTYAGSMEEDRTGCLPLSYLTPCSVLFLLQREEFDSFLQDRLHTIRLWRSVGGNTRLIEPYYCIRGLEMYESAKLNRDALTARSDYIQTILKEQNRQRGGALDWEKVKDLMAPRSAWALKQASRLAWKDTLEAQDDFDLFADSPTHMMDSDLPTMRRLSMTNIMNGIQERFASYPTRPAYTNNNAAVNLPRQPVDIHKLKEMNRQFLHTMASQKQPSQQKQPLQQKRLRPNDSLADLLVQGKRHEFQNQQAPIVSHDQPLEIGNAIRRDSLYGFMGGQQS
jgi:hypothetical protein